MGDARDQRIARAPINPRTEKPEDQEEKQDHGYDDYQKKQAFEIKRRRYAERYKKDEFTQRIGAAC